MTTRASTSDISVETTDTSIKRLELAIAALQAQVTGMRAEVAQLRQAVIVRTGADPAPFVQPQVSTPGPEPYRDDPRHDEAYVRAVLAGDQQRMRTALREARDRISGEITARGGQPASPAEFDLADRRQRDSHEQRRAAAAEGLDMTGLPVEPGGTLTRNPDTGQITVRHGQRRTCGAGHPAEAEADLFCRICGRPVSAPAIGETWNIPEQDVDLATQRRLEEGTI